MFKYGVLLLLLFSLYGGWAQNGFLIKQQYRRGPRMASQHRILNFELEAHVVKMKQMQSTTFPKNDFNVGARTQIRFTRTFGVTAGLNYLNLTYQYHHPEDILVDRNTYLSVPFTLRLFVNETFNFEAGALYNKTLRLTKTATINGRTTVSNIAPESAGENLGMLIGMHIKLFRAVRLSAQYRFAKRISYPGKSINNNVQGVLLGLQCSLLRNSSSKKTPLDLGIKKR